VPIPQEISQVISCTVFLYGALEVILVTLYISHLCYHDDISLNQSVSVIMMTQMAGKHKVTC